MIMASAIHPLATIRLVGVIVFALSLSLALAQPGAGPTADERLNGLTVILDRIAAALSRPGLSDDELKALRAEAINVGEEARAIAAAHDPIVSDLRARLDQLKPDAAPPHPEAPDQGAPADGGSGEPPAPGEGATPEPSESPESPESPAPADPLAAEVTRLEAELLAAETIVKRAWATETRAQQQASQIAGILRDRFNQRIFGRTRSLVDPSLWIDAARELPASSASTRRVIGGLLVRTTSRGPIVLIPLAVLVLALAFAAVPQLRRRVIALVAKLVGQSEASAIGKAVTALLVAAFVTAIPPIGYWAAIYLARAIDAVPLLLTFLLNETGAAILVVSAAFGFTRAILAPNRPAWRIASIDDATAVYLARRLPLPALFVALGLILEGLAKQASFASPVSLAAAGLVSLFFAVILVETMRRVRLMLARQLAAASDAATQKQFRLARVGTVAAALAGGVILGALIIGYLPFAWFLTKQVVWVSLVLASYALIANLLDALGATYCAPESRAGARLADRGGLGAQWVVQFGIIFIAGAKLLAAIAGLLLIIAPWGVTSAGLVVRARAALTGFEVGGLRISLLGIAAAVLLFALGIVLTRALQRWLRERYLPLTEIDPGLKTSIVTATGYLGIIATVTIAFAWVGVDLSRLALVAGALSVGIGFGLQSIVNNFVSGLILLAERPIKAGDWIIVGSEEGTVKKINVRATELETFDRASVVIPNSDLISGTVKNWVLGGTMGRVSIIIGVAYGSDADQVREILRGCAADHALVLHYPEPNVFLIDFADSALMFRLDAYLADISNGFRVRSDIRFEILKRFREAGIEIPFPQRDINLRASGEVDGLIDRMLARQPGDTA